MNELALQLERDSDFSKALVAIQQPRTAYVLRHFVVNQHDTLGQRWAQCVLEMQQKVAALATAQIDREIAEIQIARLKKRGTPIALLKAKKKQIELKQLEWAEIGAARELADLKAIYDEFGRMWTREELEQEQAEYWTLRLNRQAMQDVNANGRIGVGNQDALRMAGMPAPGMPDYIEAVQRRFLETGKLRILVTVPTLIPREQIKSSGLRCLEGWQLPATIEQQVYVVEGKSIADAYTDAALKAMADGADFLLTVEDDHVIPQGAFERLWRVYQQHGPRAIVGAWYPQKRQPRAGAAIVVQDGRRDYLLDTGGDGGACEVLTVPQGFTLIPVSIFRELPRPWFATTGNLTQDSFFSQLAREAGYKLLVDTGCRIKHVCRETGRVYE